MNRVPVQIPLLFVLVPNVDFDFVCSPTDFVTGFCVVLPTFFPFIVVELESFPTKNGSKFSFPSPFAPPSAPPASENTVKVFELILFEPIGLAGASLKTVKSARGGAIVVECRRVEEEDLWRCCARIEFGRSTFLFSGLLASFSVGGGRDDVRGDR